MTGSEVWQGAVAVVTGAASGIGGALTTALVDAGARVYALDIAPVSADVSTAISCDLGDRSSIDRATELLPAEIDIVFNCAGVPNGGRFDPARVMAINWLGLRHLSESLLGRIPAGGSITHVASTAGRGWPTHVDELRSLLCAASFEDGQTWVADNAEVVGDGYAFSKEAVQWYTMWRGLQTVADHGVRMNSVCPGVTNTQLAADFRRGVGDDVIDRAIAVAGRAAEPTEMVGALLFLADRDAASYVNGVNLNVDRGTGAAHATGQF